MDEKNIEQNAESGQETGKNGTEGKAAGGTLPDQGKDTAEGQGNTQAEKDTTAEYERKLADLEIREMKLLLREKLHDRNMPKEFADIINCKDAEDIDAKLDILQKCGVGSKKDEGTGFVKIGRPEQNCKPVDPYRQVMGLE